MVKAFSTFGWHKYTGLEGDTYSIDGVVAYAPGPQLMEKFDCSVNNFAMKENRVPEKKY